MLRELYRNVFNDIVDKIAGRRGNPVVVAPAFPRPLDRRDGGATATFRDSVQGSAARLLRAVYLAPSPAIFGIFIYSILAAGSLPAQVNVLTANYGNDRTNANVQERTLKPSNVSGGRFGKLFSVPVDGQIYTQPLYASGIAVPGKRIHNMVYVATMHNSVYAIDADDGSLIWHVKVGASVSSADFGMHDISPEIGILGTPVIDPAAGVIYLVNFTSGDGVYSYWLHALDIATGDERMEGPAQIQGATPGNAPDSVDGVIPFVPAQHLQRPGLLLLNGVVYIAFGSHEDQDPYHGWIMAYSGSDLSQQPKVFNTTANGSGGAIWQSGRGLAADDQGNIFAISANGDSDGQRNFGESFLRLGTASGPAISDWYTPSDWAHLTALDLDLGSAGPVLVPGTNLVLGASKLGVMYSVDRTHMGGASPEESPAAEFFRAQRNWIFNMAVWTSPAGPVVYLQSEGDGITAFCMYTAAFEQTFETVPCARNSSSAASAQGGMAISADGSTPGTAILWTTTRVPGPNASGALHAFDASDVSKELWSSDLDPNDAVGVVTKFATPTVVAGKVYVPTSSGQLAVYGLKSAPLFTVGSAKLKGAK